MISGKQITTEDTEGGTEDTERLPPSVSSVIDPFVRCRYRYWFRSA